MLLPAPVPGPGPRPALHPVMDGAAQPEPPGYGGGGWIPSGVAEIGREELIGRQRITGKLPFHAALSHRIHLIDESHNFEMEKTHYVISFPPLPVRDCSLQYMIMYII